MATGAAVLAAGALLGSAAGRRKERAPRSGPAPGPPLPGALDDLTDRPVAQAALTESLAAARRVDTLARNLESIETRVHAIERANSAERVDAVWQRVLHLEERLEQIRAQRTEVPIDAIVAQAESRLSPRIHTLETRVEEHHAAIQQLQAHAVQTDANIQKMIAAVEKLTEQIARVLPSASGRIEPRRESAAAAAAAEGSPQGSGSSEGGEPAPRRWKALALVALLAVSLAGSWLGMQRAPFLHPAVVAASAGPAPTAPADPIDAAVASPSRLVPLEPGDAPHAGLASERHDARAIPSRAGLPSRQQRCER